MASLTVWKFSTAEGADNALVKLRELQKQQLIEVLDAAIVSWPQGRKRPKTYQAMDTVGAGALGGAFWGMLFGLIFFMPLLGLAVGATVGAITGHFTDYGINDDFIKDIQTKVTEGTSALFLMTGRVTLDKVEAAFAPEERGELIQSNLSAEQEAKLREDFGAEI
ncbi:putative membrane protein [Leptolyngbyaceae cyanobacterium JSC-12]|nr:putative membrane protein [Leptolyngbyaceae cyanobacterium JSC-12]